MPVTCVEMVDLVATAFRTSYPTRAEILGVAVRENARPAVLELLRALPDRRYQDVRDIWTALPETSLAD